MAIVKRLCALANIEIALESELGVGTATTLLIPVSHASHENVPGVTPAAELDTKMIVVVDDEQDILTGMRHLLSSWNCRAIVAESAGLAIEKLHGQDQRPDFIISDLRLRHGEQGIDAIEAIREEYNSEIPALLITGDTAPERISEAKASGLAVMYKPIETEDLKSAINTLLAQ